MTINTAPLEKADLVRSRLLDDIPHGFTTRKIGYSTGIVSGLNLGLGSDDDRETVLKNRALAAETILPGAELITVHQVHGTNVLHATAPIALDKRPKADAIVTKSPGLVLGALGADCPPVLYADRKAGVIGAAHSGWRGAFAGVNEACVTAMEHIGANRADIVAAIGPAIAQKNYEVDQGFFENFYKAAPENERFFKSGKPGHWQFDLEGYVAARLAAFGVGTIDCPGLDTYGDEERFYSYRRATHRGEADYGRHMGAIALRK